MKNQLLSVLLLTITVLFQQARSAPDQIIELFRHGARSPLNNLDHSWHDYVTLTPVGYRQHYILGKVLSKKYSDLIENAFRNNEVYLFSSNAPRCIQSAGAHLHGMYSSIDKKGVALREDYPREIAVPGFEDPYVAEVANSIPNNEEILYNFFPGVFRIADKVEQYVFNGEQPSFCPKMGELFDKNRKDSYTQEKWKEFEDTINNLNNALHGNYYIRNPEELISYGDPMIADIFDNRTILGGLNDRALIENITWIGTLFYYHFAQSQQIQKELSSFHIVEIFLEQLDNFRKGESYSTAAFFSGHDNNLLALLSAFGIINEECILENFYSVAKTGQVLHPACQYPSFASDIIVEFYNQTQTPHVKMFHKNIPLKICNGKEECEYEEFVIWARNASGNNTRETYFEKCGKNAPEQKPAPLKQKARQEPLVFATKPKVVSSDDSMMIQVGLNVLLVLICLGLGYKILKDRKKYMRITNERERAYQQQYDINDKSIQDP